MAVVQPKPMSRRTVAIAAALSVLALGSPLVTGCKNSLAINFYNSGVEKHKEDDFQGAIDNYTKTIQVNPKNTDAYNNRGLVKDGLGDYHGAMADYNKAVKIKPLYVLAYGNRGI